MEITAVRVKLADTSPGGPAMTAKLTRPQRAVLAHALGLDLGPRAFRNHHCSGPGGAGHAIVLKLVAAGLMAEGEHAGKELTYYHVTEKGRNAIGAPAAEYEEDVWR